MTKRKLQIFLSSTYEDLIEHRLAAMEAILAAGHIPAAMEQFSPGDETAWEKIRSWIDESDAFILILGGRYGSLEPESGKSYVQLEYEYAMERKKPFFALVIHDKYHEERVKQLGLAVDERTHRREYDEFKRVVTQRLCRFWGDKKDIQAAIFQKLPEWAQRSDLNGWVRGDEVATTHVTNELARLSEENRDLRSKLSINAESFDGISFEEMAGLLRNAAIRYIDADIKERASKVLGREPQNVGELFEILHESLATHGTYNNRTLDPLISFGLAVVRNGVSNEESVFILTDVGRRFRNRILLFGDRDKRLNELWASKREVPSAGHLTI